MSEDETIVEEEYNPLTRALSTTEGALIALLSFWMILAVLIFFGRISEETFVQLFLTSGIVYPLLRRITE